MQIDRLKVGLLTIRLQSGQQNQIVGQRLHSIDLISHLAECTIDHIIVIRTVLEGFYIAPHHRQWRAQFVGDIAHKLFAHLF